MMVFSSPLAFARMSIALRGLVNASSSPSFTIASISLRRSSVTRRDGVVMTLRI